MAKRGRPPKAETARKSEPISIRLTPQLRAALEELRKRVEPERTLSQEIEVQLWVAIHIDQQIEKRFHGLRNYYVAQIITAGIANFIEPITGRRVWDDPYAFDEARAFIVTFLDYLRPRGRGSVPKDTPPQIRKKRSLGELTAAMFAVFHQSAVRNSYSPSWPVHRLKTKFGQIEKAAPNIVAQLAKSGRSPLADLAVILGEPLSSVPTGVTRGGSQYKD